ncbi:DUF1631 family protein [Thermomonas haemolytica]|uniref:Uncharacterized protein DUF1631 n=1 Tax=Thermomonas haemolytica TaxID=141949 RepID=A0A4V2V1N6_9GAMM|nr:DUF1631 family protein [Thermomonas haemolytica]TCT21862.1 uncharacterized protein DUF1631 [Thermomonas haemolytica]TNY29798.1 hypothetical protein BV505_03135 [Thermomonas haemolytica]
MTIAASTTRKPPATLAEAALPRRARQALERLLVDVRAEMGQQLPQLLQDTELGLSRATPSSEPALETARLAAIRSLGRGGHAFTTRFMAQVEASLATLQAARAAHAKADAASFTELRLLEDDELSDETTLQNMASRMEARNSLALQLLGHRLGVLAAAPALEGEALPLGPYALCNALADAADGLELSRYARLQLFQQFEKAMAEFYPPMLEAANARLAQDGILPFLSFVPVRVRPGSAAPSTLLDDKGANAPSAAGQREARGTEGGATGRTPGHGGPGHAAGSPGAGMAGGAAPGAGAGVPLAFTGGRAGRPTNPAFNALQGLLHRRRLLLAKLRPGGVDERVRETLRADEVLGALQRMRSTATKAESLADYRQILLAQARQLHGHGVALSDIDNDSFDLLALYLTQLQRELRRHSPGETLVERLRLPLAQLALRDQRFFTDPAHPARQLLNAVSLAGARWLAEDDLDSQWLGLLQRAVAAVQQDSEGALDTFIEANRTLQSGLQAQARKAEMTERRQVEAARGREKLALARQRANEEVQRLLHGRSLPRFQAILIEQAWIDVLALTHLRSGEASEAWRDVLATSARIIDLATGEAAAAGDDALAAQIRGALEQVGYHAEDATTIAHQLGHGGAQEGDLASRTELLVQLRARARLGEGNEVALEPPAPLAPTELAARDRLRALQTPAWVELLDASDFPLRRRLAWASTQTSQALLVNRRGQRASGEDLDVLARMLAAGNLRLLDGDPSPAEMAWDATLASLQRIGQGDSDATGMEPTDGN